MRTRGSEGANVLGVRACVCASVCVCVCVHVWHRRGGHLHQCHARSSLFILRSIIFSIRVLPPIRVLMQAIIAVIVAVVVAATEA
jgi:hypothetical protein